MQRCDMAERHELPEENIDAIREKIKQLEAKEQDLIERQQQLHDRQKELKAEHRAKHSINMVEPDAMMMSNVNGDKSRPGYNAQIAVDSKTHFIVANETVQDRNDQRQFIPQYKNVTTTLGHDANRQYNVDSGYFASAQLEYLFENDIDAIINDPMPELRSNRSELPTLSELMAKNRPLNRGDFRYHPDADYYECPAGEKLVYVRRKNGAKRSTDLYQCAGCDGCPLKSQCLATNNKNGYRNISRDEREIYAERMSDKLRSEDAKERLKLRAMTVEPVFGNLKENLGFRRFRLRGIENVKAEFNLMCIGHNINILFKHARSKKKRAMMILSKVEKQLYDFFDFSFLRYQLSFVSNQ
jgi:transposase